MKKLVLIHGINQQNTTAEEITDSWLEAIRAAAGRDAAWAKSVRAKTVTPFYGTTLADLSSTSAPTTVPQGIDDAPDDFALFAGEALRDMALKLGATEEDIALEAGTNVVPQGAGPHKSWLKALARVIQRISPLHGALAVRLLKQAHVYLSRPHAADAVNDIVRPALEGDEPMVLVTHSLGTVVSYALLREFAANHQPRTAPLYVTLGSPLSIDVVRRNFNKPRTRPADIARWVNGADPHDFVALNNELTIDNFGPGIENISDIHNSYENPHAIVDYLSDPRVARLIADSLDS